jgi:protein-disulfide isomerase
MTPHQETETTPLTNTGEHHTHHHPHKKGLTTPQAIVIGSIIIACGIVGYGMITSQGQTGTKTVSSPLPKILKTIGVNKKEFETCVNSGEMGIVVSSSIDDGVNAGVSGTPTTFVVKEQDGKLYTIATITGAQTYDFLEQAINEALTTTKTKTFPVFKGRKVEATEHKEGSTSNGVYVIEYSDMECPFCIRFHYTVGQVRDAFADTGKIAFVYRHFPLTSIHPHAQKEAEMASCVGKLKGDEGYFSFIDQVFDFKVKNDIGYLPVGN